MPNTSRSDIWDSCTLCAEFMIRWIGGKEILFREAALVLDTFFITHGISNFSGKDFLTAWYIPALKNTAILLEIRRMKDFPILTCIFVILAAKKKFQIILNNNWRPPIALNRQEQSVNKRVNGYLLSYWEGIPEAVSSFQNYPEIVKRPPLVRMAA